MIHEVEAGALDETAMMAYAMSVERAQLTISDRRPTVQDLPPRPLAAVASL
jgi:VanZ family protein